MFSGKGRIYFVFFPINKKDVIVIRQMDDAHRFLLPINLEGLRFA